MKAPKREVHGILLLDKPKGITSNAALQQVKRLYQAKKAGHSGSLDPVASGLLPICFGEGTKFSRFLLEADKQYVVTARLGIRTETGDSEGQIVMRRDVPKLSSVALETYLEAFRGEISQIPSMFSALKYQGVPLYKYARQGIEIPREARDISIFALEVLYFEQDVLKLMVHASKGTYIRTLVDDLGEALGCGAHVEELRRLKSGPYHAEQMVSLLHLEQLAVQNDFAKLDALLLPLGSALSGMPMLTLSEAAAYYLRQGQPVIVPYAPTEGWVQLLMHNNHFLGVGEVLSDGRIAPRRLTNSNLV